MTTQDPAQELRAAAEQLRTLAAQANHHAPSTEYVGLLRPGTGLLIADWLDASAEELAALTWADPDRDSLHRALAVARAMLGTPS
ncbi:hypothetical protein [Kitasatospora viridis]|uniref:Uncharacterized protein n=1 Tax=Kitasatospora viridis TaxID=281105 RepID=A0A561UKQ3_9ACTN|nr:hypothetical protein [Kitasatospora viridis]TWF99943.1 hypothetical protein FHX73_113803 [Kitasatospora viridis]